MGVDDIFNRAIKSVLANEGGYSNDPHDSGGETNFGISKRSYPNVDIKNLTADKAIAIYKRDYWDSNNYGQIINPDLAIKVFNLAVNMGAREANKLLQECLGPKIVADGILGPISIAAINAWPWPIGLMINFKEKASHYYNSLALTEPVDMKFLTGWLKRVNE